MNNRSTEQTILCVDDEINILQAFKRLLRKDGYQILTATSGSEGLSLLENNPDVQVVISDQRMPEMSGSEFLMKTKQIYPDIIRIVLSGYAEAGAIVEAINEAEVYHFLTKPWNDDEVRATLKQCFEHYHLRTENRLLLKQTREQNKTLQQLNEQLKEKVDFQTYSLWFSQEVLDKLPIPVMGISIEGLLVLKNEVARNTSLLSQMMVGEHVAEMLPQEINSAIENISTNFNTSPITADWITKNQKVRAHLMPVCIGEKIHGCILTLEIWP